MGSKISKTARFSTVKMYREEKPKLKNAEMIDEIRRLSAAGLFVANMDYVRALLEEYEKAIQKIDKLEAELNEIKASSIDTTRGNDGLG